MQEFAVVTWAVYENENSNTLSSHMFHRCFSFFCFKCASDQRLWLAVLLNLGWRPHRAMILSLTSSVMRVSVIEVWGQKRNEQRNSLTIGSLWILFWEFTILLLWMAATKVTVLLRPEVHLNYPSFKNLNTYTTSCILLQFCHWCKTSHLILSCTDSRKVWI